MTHLPQAIVDTVLNGLALLFLTGAAGDPTTARQAAAHMLAAYNPGTPDELSLASEIISFSFHALEALSDASNPELSLNKILRLRGSAVSLSRESHKAQRKLDQLQRARRAGSQPEQAEAPQPAPKIGKAVSVVAAERPAAQPTAKTQAKFPPLGSFHKFEAARLITETLQRKQAEHLIATAATTPAARPAA
jgi:hypothetical protein